MSEYNSPIPNMTDLRRNKPGYDTRYPVNRSDPRYNENLVDLRTVKVWGEHWFADAQSYYAQPNRMTGEPLPGVPNAPLVREGVARRLVAAERMLRYDPEIRRLLGAPAHLAVRDALRPLEAQRHAFEVAWPAIIREQHPDWTEEEVRAEVPKFCARPKEDATPTPHLTGGAVDVALINLETGEPFDRGYAKGSMATAYPDFHEGYHLVPGQSDIEGDLPEVASPGSEVVLGRRVLYWVMTEPGEAGGGFEVNPNEIWHYGTGDPLSAYVNERRGGTFEQAYYGIAHLPEEHRPQ